MYFKRFLCGATLLLFFVALLNAQESRGTKPVNLTFSVENVSLREVLEKIEQQADVLFSYDSALSEKAGKVTFRAVNEPLDKCMERLCESFSLTWKRSGRYIILKKAKTLKTCTISGCVMDDSGETLLSATVQDVNSHRGTVSNDYGFYSLTVPVGNVRLKTSYVGFQGKEHAFCLKKDTVISFLLAANAALQEVVVEGENRNSHLLGVQTGTTRLSGADIKSVSAVLSSPDLVKRLQFLSGVAVGTELLAGMYVRGGNTDENLFLIDGNPVYQASHLAGVFSSFNVDAIKTVDFYKSSFPARYGGRLSSVVDVRTKDGDMKQYHGTFSIGLTEGRIQLEGPIIKDRTSFNFALRRTWLDVFTAPTLAIINAKHKDDKFSFRYAFHDLNAKITHHFSERSRTSLSVYSGTDVFNQTDNGKEGSGIDLYQNKNNMEMRWGNLIASLNWNYEFNNRLFGNISVVSSTYSSKVQEHTEKMKGIDETGNWISYEKRNRKNKTSIQDWGYRADFDYRPSALHHIRFGSDYLFHTFHPEENRDMMVIEGKETDKTDTQESDSKPVQAHEFSVYAEDEIDINHRWRLNVGLRGTLFSVQKKNYLSVEPRLASRFLLMKNFSLKASYTEMSQYVHMLSTTYLSLPSDLWVPVTGKIPPMRSRQVSMGVYYQLPFNMEVDLEGYYKTMKHMVDYRDTPRFSPAYEGWEKKVADGEGRSYGMEMSLRRTSGRITCEAAYTLSWTERRFDAHNSGEWYPARFDNLHKLNLSATYRFSKKVELFAAWVYATGNRVTVPLEYHYIGMEPGKWYNYGSYTSYFKSPNNVVLPAYHRLDLGINIYKTTKRGRQGIWNISLYNAYCRFNPMSINLESSGDLQNGNREKAVAYGIIPIVPAFSYTLKF